MEKHETKTALVNRLIAELEAKGRTAETVTKEDMKEWHLHISRSNGKVKSPCIDLLGGCEATCACDVPCAKLCYAKRGKMGMPYIKKLHKLNWYLWKADPKRFEQEVYAGLINDSFCRFHADGDIPDDEYLCMMRRTAKRLRKTAIWCMNKKMKQIVNGNMERCGKLPKNLHLMSSNWGNWVQPNPYNLPVFAVIMRNGAGKQLLPENAFHCMGDCDFCKINHCGCPYAKHGDYIWIDQH